MFRTPASPSSTEPTRSAAQARPSSRACPHGRRGRQARSSHSGPRVQVLDGVRLRGRIRDASLVRAAAQLVRAVEGIVDVYCELTAQDAPAV
ncbi:BON domain-containing protein [Streptomyces sp. NPDC001685]